MTLSGPTLNFIGTARPVLESYDLGGIAGDVPSNVRDAPMGTLRAAAKRYIIEEMAGSDVTGANLDGSDAQTMEFTGVERVEIKSVDSGRVLLSARTHWGGWHYTTVTCNVNIAGAALSRLADMVEDQKALVRNAMGEI